MNTPSRYINYLHVPILIGILWFGLPDKVPAQDFFFEPVTSVGGYGELHLNSVQNSATGDWNKTLDFHRFILFVSHAWSEQWSFKSEIEIEHNYIQDGQGEVALEQAYVQYRSLANWTIQAGVVLPTVGWINTGHEPPLFYSVERPAYAKALFPLPGTEMVWLSVGRGNRYPCDWRCWKIWMATRSAMVFAVPGRKGISRIWKPECGISVCDIVPIQTYGGADRSPPIAPRATRLKR